MKSQSNKIYLDRNEMTAGPAPECLAVLQRITADQLSCYTRDYSKGIKSSLSQKLAELNNVLEERILLGSGSEDLIKQCVHCYLGSGSVLLKPELSWWYYDSVASEVGAATKTFSLVREERRFRFDSEMILRAYHDSRPEVLLISSPNNPTGNSLPLGDVWAVLNGTRDSVVVLDQAYHGFSAEDELPVPELLAQFPNLVILRTFSKLYGLAGARVGYAMVGEGNSKLVRFSKKYLGYNRISEYLALAALNATDYYEALRLLIRREMRKYYEALSSLPGVTVYESNASFVLVRFPEEVNGVIRSSLSEKGVAVKFFDDDDVRLRNHIRISIGLPAENDLVIEAVTSALAGRRVAAA